MSKMYEDMTPEERAAADRNPIVVKSQDEFYEALDESHRTGRPVEVPSIEKAREWGYGDSLDG